MYKNTERKIDELLDKMTLDEKIGQLVQSGPSLVGGFTVPVEELFAMAADGRISQEEFEKQMDGAKEDIPADDIREGTVGSFLGVTGADNILRAQKIAVEKLRLGIPVLAAFDVIHGFKTVFPIPLAEKLAVGMQRFLRRRHALPRMKPVLPVSTGYLRLWWMWPEMPGGAGCRRAPVRIHI